MSHHTERLAHLMPLLQQTAAHLGVQYTVTGRHLGLTNTRMVALVTVAAADGRSMSDIAQALDLAAPLATRTIDELTERGLIERSGDRSDRRRVLVSATAAGARAIDDVHAEAAELIAAVLERMTSKEQDALVLGLEALLRAMHEPQPDGVPGPLSGHTHGRPGDHTHG